jgi:hypothetical protein
VDTSRPNVQQAIARHLGGDQPFAGGQLYRSSFHALLTEARDAAGRDELTGTLIIPERGQRWLGTTAYLMLLDQVGTCFEPTDSTRLATKVNPFLRALIHFSTVTDDLERKALYALRCAFAHDYSLFNNSWTDELRHAFHLSVSPTDPVVRLPPQRWGGNYPPLPEGVPHWQITWVNLQAVGDVVEGVVQQVRNLHAADQLELRLGLSEFEMRYGMVIPG